MISGFGLTLQQLLLQASIHVFFSHMLAVGRILLEQRSPGRCKDLKLLRHIDTCSSCYLDATCSHPTDDNRSHHQPSVLQVPAAVAEAQGAGVCASLCQSMAIWFLLPLDTFGS